jgi:alpha-D-ribose 1-methylphosphonate 5-triphosphate synthase subunit PhnL
VPSVSSKSGGEPSGSELVALAGNMLFDTVGRRVYVEKVSLSAEDTVAFAFAGALEALGIRYSVVAGYVSIFFGRSRRSDVIDFIAEPIGEDRFTALCAELRNRGFSPMQGDINLGVP